MNGVGRQREQVRRARIACSGTVATATLTALVCATIAFGAGAQTREPAERASGSSLAEALRNGTARIDLRYRFELVDQDGLDPSGRASTLRTVLGYRSATWRGLALRLAAENVSDVGGSRLHANAGFGDRGNGVVDRPVIADPPGTDMIEAYGEYSNDDSRLRIGRQEILIGDQRFVGAVGWRQHHQTFRAISLHDESFVGMTLDYAYVDRVYRITGERAETSHHLITTGYELADAGTITAYAYLLRFDEPARVGQSTNTFGAELRGERTLGQLPLRYEAEFAHQRAAGDNPFRINADYLHLSVSFDLRGVGITAGMEALDGSAADGQFNTPLATLHGWNGWADKFLVTPTNGLRDLYLRASGRAGSLGWSAAYHRFSAKTGGATYGSELDAQITYRTSWDQSFGLKAARYSADTHATDTTKLWLTTAYTF